MEPRLQPNHVEAMTNKETTFRPGDKVRDLRDNSRKTWRIVAVFGHTELMTLQEVGDDSHQITVSACELVPYLEMVAMSK